MNHSFDIAYTQNQKMYGHPYQELQNYFQNIPQKGSVLDLGCGQGRDSLFLASIGFDVTAVDNSKVGIDQLREKASQKNLDIKAIVADVCVFKTEKKFSIVLFDMLLHSFEREEQKKLLEKYAQILSNDGIFCIVFPDDMNTEHFMNILSSFEQQWKLGDEITIIDTPKDSDGKNDYIFKMITIHKT